MIKKIPVALAARMMGKKPTFIYIGLQRQILPFGHAVKMGDGRTAKFSYYISPRLFIDYTGFSEDDIVEAAEAGGFVI
jgi:hypothetical protein